MRGEVEDFAPILMHVTLCLLLAGSLAVVAQPLETKPNNRLEKFKPAKAPEYKQAFLKPGDRLAICGDSITEQKMYSRIMEDYLTMCVPELEITVRQYGWSGERAPGFLARMTNDCLRFKPTVATTCPATRSSRSGTCAVTIARSRSAEG